MERRRTREFFARSALEVARDLIGNELVHVSAEGTVAGVIVETEAYCGTEDPASHTYGGRRTPRNETMWGPPGHTYVYPIYGKYHCLNLVCATEGVPEAVLIRAARPTVGVDLMAARRDIALGEERDRRRLCSGPSRLCISFGIDRIMNGMDLCGRGLFVTEGRSEMQVVTSARIGIDYAEEARWWPWRFLAKGDPYVSRRP